MSYGNEGLVAAQGRAAGKIEGAAHAFEGLAGEAEGIRNTLHTMLERLRGPVPTPANTVGGLGDKVERARPLVERLGMAGDRIQTAHQQSRDLLNELSTYI